MDLVTGRGDVGLGTSAFKNSKDAQLIIPAALEGEVHLVGKSSHKSSHSSEPSHHCERSSIRFTAQNAQ